MNPLELESTPEIFGPPKGQEGEIGFLPYRWSTEYGYKEVVSIWKPSKEELDVLNAGGNVLLGVGWIGGFPPVRVGTTYEGGEQNGGA